MKSLSRCLVLVLGMTLTASLVRAQDLSDRVKERLEYWTQVAEKWASDPVIVSAVAAQNTTVPDSIKEMTQERWTALPDKDPFVYSFVKNEAAKFFREKRPDSITEAFLSDAEGRKVAFLAKTTNWSHKGKPKHDQPMAGKTWRGALELDKSSGMRQIQISVPVMQDGKPIGSLVLGIALTDVAAN